MSQRAVPLQNVWTTVDGVPIYARVALDSAPSGGPAIVLVHGFIISSRYMVPLAEQLAPYFRVYAPDLPGFGNSGEPGRVLALEGLADALAGWIQAVGLEQVVLIGNSFGCQVVATFAARHPGRLKQAVLIGPTVDPQRRSVLQQAVCLLLDAPLENPSLWVLHIPDYFKAGLRRIVQTARYTLDDRIEARLPSVTVPTLVVRGAGDPIVPQRWAERVTELLPRGYLAVIPGAHALNYSVPQQVTGAVRAFLADGGQSGPEGIRGS